MIIAYNFEDREWQTVSEQLSPDEFGTAGSSAFFFQRHSEGVIDAEFSQASVGKQLILNGTSAYQGCAERVLELLQVNAERIAL